MAYEAEEAPGEGEGEQRGEASWPGCGLYMGWILASGMGMGLGWALGWQLSFAVPALLAALAIGLVAGAILGGMQALLLRGHFRQPGWWVLATGLGWAAGMLFGSWIGQGLGLTEIGLGLSIGAVTGALLGVFQWLFLRRQVTRAGWWLPASLLGWTSGLVYYRPGVSGIGLLYGVLAGIVTGLALYWLLNRPVAE